MLRYHKTFWVKDLFLISFSVSDIESIKAGQFVSVLCDNHTLRRPFSVYNFDEVNKIVSIYFKLKGSGTKYMSGLKIGDIVDFVGPMGNGFHITEKKSLIIGAGVGFAPVFYLAKKLKNVYKVGAFSGIKDIPAELVCDQIITDDGTAGKKGSVIDYLEEIISEVKPEIIYACGPNIVLEAVAKTGVAKQIPTEIAMEKIMACSIGVCRGCVIKVKNKSNKIKKN